MEKFIYMLVGNGYEWEDMILFTEKEEAIQMSKKYPKERVQIFQKTNAGFVPIYSYYQNGELHTP